MPANIESMFYVREVPWHGLGVRVEEALTSHEAISAAGLDWQVVQKPIYTSDFVCSIGNIHSSDKQLIPNYKANVRDSDNQVLGVVSDRYNVVQNEEAFAFTDALIGEGVRYETAGSLQSGRKVWLLAKLPEKYIIGGERIEPFLVFSNSHDGSGAIKVCMTPIRVVCQNTLNLALDTAKRSWSSKHTVNIKNRLDEVRDTLKLAHGYMVLSSTHLAESS
jgi:phage/plasmid-like protein (TIGR03299 family)